MGGAGPGGPVNELTTAGRLGRVRATAHAKLNVSLQVLGRRDDGFHELEALTVSLNDPHDVVEIEAVPHPAGITFEMVGITDEVPTDRSNLAYRAAEELLVRAGRSGHGVKVRLRKRIPAGAGLGGGSADAAAALVAVRRMLDIDIDDEGLAAIAATVGSDVPFCLWGGAAWMRGRGEILERAPLPSGLHFLVAVPPLRLSTAAVYAAWDELGGPQATRSIAPVGPLAEVATELVNDLEAAAEAVEPKLREFREALEAAAGTPPLLAGSGSGYVIPLDPDGPDPAAEARRVSRALRNPVTAVSSVSRGVRLDVG